MSRRLPELPDEAVAEYWQLVRAALVAGGMSKAEAAAAAKAFREFMKPAGWTIYNRDPEDSARLATKHAAWVRKESDKVADKPKPAPKRAKPPAKTADTLPTKEEIEQLPRWARVSFAARCARRVEPLFHHNWPSASETHERHVRHAVEHAEMFASEGMFDLDVDGTATFSAVEAAEAGDAATAAEAIIAANVADAAYAAASVITAVDPADATVATVVSASDAADASDLAWLLRQDYETVSDAGRRRNWTDDTPVPPSVFGPLWPEGPPADWPELPKPTTLTLTVQVPDNLDDAAVSEKLKILTVALARLNVAGGGHGLKLIPPIDFTHEQEKGRADVVREEGEKPKGRGNARRGH